MKISICKSVTLFFLIAGIVFSISGCGSSGGMNDGETSGGTPAVVVAPAAIEMSTGKTSIPADGISSTTVTAAMTGSSGQPVSQGTSVTFSTTLGKFPNGQTSYTVKTPDETGSVSTSIIAGNIAGTAQIRGLAGSVSQATTLEFTGGTGIPPAATITLTATPDKIPSDGVSFSKITATLKDSGGTPVSAGTVLNFTTTYGTFLSGGQSATAVTDANGSGSVSLISSTTDAVATVTCSSGGIAQVISVIFGQGATNLPVASISLSANPSTINPDGFSSTVVTATLSDSGGTAVPDGTQVRLSTTLGRFPNGTQSIALTTSGGKAAVALISNEDEEGVAKVTASAGGVSQSTSVFIGVTEETAPPSKITIKAGAASLIPNGKTSTNIDVNVTDSKGTAVADGTQVTVAIIEGTGSFDKNKLESVVTRGTVSGTLPNLTYYAYSTPGTVVIQASTQNGLSASVPISLTEGLIVLSANPAELIANGSAESTITAQLRDADFNILQDAGIRITFSADSGTFKSSGDRQVTGTTQGGVSTVTYVAARQSGAVKISASATGYGSAETSLTLVSQQIASLLLSTPEAVPADGVSSTTLTATAKDSGGKAVSKGTPITFKISNTGYGKFPNGTGEFTVETPDDSGAVTVSVISAGTTAGIAVVTATAGNVTQSTTVEFSLPGATQPSMTLSGPAELTADGKTSGTITATLKQASGDSAPAGTSITFSTSTVGKFPNGTRSYTVKTANDTGTVTVALLSETVSASTLTTVTASALGISRSIDILFILNPPAFILTAEGYPDPTSINVKGTGGQATSQIVFDVKDSSGNLVGDGYRIDFEILTGPNGGEELSPAYAVTVNGQVSTILRSGFKSGPVSIKATYHDNTAVSTSTSQITIKSGPPVGEEFGISAQYYNISGLYIINLQDPIQADVGDFSGNAVPENTAISFKTYNTGGEIHPASAGTSGIYAASTLYSVASPIPSQGFLSVTAEAINGGRTTHITSLAVVRQTENTQILYAGTDGGGVYKSTNSGSTWQNISRSSTIQGQNWIQPYVNDVAVDPDNYNTVYAATGYLGKGNLYRSFDGGLNWNSNHTEEWNGVFSTDSVAGGSGAVLTVLCDDDGSDTGNGDRYVWIGTEGLGVFYATDGKHFSQSGSLGHGKIVQDIVKVEGTNGSSAKLYAGTATGVFRSTDGGVTWTKPGSGFLGDYITKLALYPKTSSSRNDVLYAGTEGAGIWVSLDSGASWTRYSGGIGKGVSASTAKADRYNKGTGNITETAVKDASGEFYKGTPSDTWTVTVTVTGSGDAAVYSYAISGKESGDKTGELLAESGYYVIPNMLRFKPEGNFKNGDKFTFTTTRDSGENIKDILVDKVHGLIYILTYFYGEEEAHPVGNVYVHDLNIDGSMPLGDWREANTNLPQFDPPDDTTLFGVHSLAMDNPDNPKALFIGGEGINFYKATTGLATGDPAWQPSKNGLTNLVMARMPILFSDICTMSIYIVTYENNYVVYEVYIQDQNGNPPISGSVFTVTLNGASVRTVTYPDTLRYQGTFYDPSDPSTDNPYIISIYLDPTKENKVVFSYKPTCGTGVPGCSGSNEEVTYTYPKSE